MATFCKNIAQNILLLSFVCRSVPWWHVRSRVFLIFLACKRCWSDLAEESRRAECGLGVLFLCISRLDRCLLRRFRGCGQVEQMHLGSIFVCMVQQSKFLGGRCGGGHAWRDVCQTQCAALPDAPCCDGWCSALRSPMQCAAMILRNPFASLLLGSPDKPGGEIPQTKRKVIHLHHEHTRTFSIGAVDSAIRDTFKL